MKLAFTAIVVCVAVMLYEAHVIMRQDRVVADRDAQIAKLNLFGGMLGVAYLKQQKQWLACERERFLDTAGSGL